jgi:hypothetical protein
MIGLKSAEDYFKRGHNLLASERKSDLEQVLQFIEKTIKDALSTNNVSQASFWLKVFDDFLNGWLEKEYKNPKIKGYGEAWFRENIDLIKMVCGRAEDGMSRKFPLYLLIKYLPKLGRKGRELTYEDLVDIHLFIFHTLRFPEAYSISNADEPAKDEKATLRLALHGAYRYDAEWLVDKLVKDSDLIKYKESLDEKAKEPYREIIKKEGEAFRVFKDRGLNAKDRDLALLFLLFTGSLEVIRQRLLDEKKTDMIYEIFKEDEEILKERLSTRISEIISLEKERGLFSFELWGLFRERIGEKWGIEKIGRPMEERSKPIYRPLSFSSSQGQNRVILDD